MLGAAATVLIVTQGHRATTLALVSLFGLLAGYAFFGRGFAYIGVAPLYVGEVVLGLAVLGVVAAVPRGRLAPVHLLLVAFMVWGALRTIPYIQAYGMEAFRDAVSWGYAAFAIVLSLVLQHSHFRTAVRWYAVVLPMLLIWIPVLAVAWYQFGPLFPTVPGTDVRIPFFKAGDMAVHLAGAAAFLLAGLYPHSVWRRLSEPLVWFFWLAGVGVASAVNRGGMLAIGVATIAVLFFVRSFDRWIPVFLTALLVVTVATASGFEVEVERGRSVSIGQLMDNLESVIAESQDSGLAGTREWREAWWNTVIDYTLRGPYFWDGKGFGINLAHDDGFRDESSALRAPHNAHLQFLARGGVPALAFWFALQAAFAVLVGRSALRCARSGQRYWLGVHAWIFVYWLAALTTMTFDVYLEGPQGGILFWSIFGAGLALAKTTPAAGPRSPEPTDPLPVPTRVISAVAADPPWLAECAAHHVDINQADLRALTRVVHIGPTRARQLVELRPFSSVADLARVPGISEARLTAIMAQGLACDRLVRRHTNAAPPVNSDYDSAPTGSPRLASSERNAWLVRSRPSLSDTVGDQP
jgi:hypothetical protein